MKEKIGYQIEIKLSDSNFYIPTSHSMFKDKDSAIKLANIGKKESPNLGIRVVEIKRKIIKVCK